MAEKPLSAEVPLRREPSPPRPAPSGSRPEFRPFIWLSNLSRGKTSLNLDRPGYYWFSSPIGNDACSGASAALRAGRGERWRIETLAALYRDDVLATKESS